MSNKFISILLIESELRDVFVLLKAEIDLHFLFNYLFYFLDLLYDKMLEYKALEDKDELMYFISNMSALFFKE
jgi:hypothetical protein